MRKLPAAVAGLALAVGLAACAPATASAPTGASGEPVAGGELVFTDVVLSTNLQTQTATAYPQANILHSVLDRLTGFDEETGEVVPWIAESFDIDDTQSVFTFRIREGVTFSDGTPLDAEAVAANLERFAEGDPDNAIPANPDFTDIASIEVDGADVIVELANPNSNFLRATTAITAGLVSLSTLELDAAGQSDISKIVGSGPFVYESSIPDQEIVFARRADYAWPAADSENRGAAYLDRVIVRAIPEVGLRGGAVASGQADVVRGLQPADEAPLEAAGGTVVAAPGVDLTANILGIRSVNDVVADPAVRRALQISIDRQALIDTVLSDSYTPAASILNRGAPGWVDLSDEIAYDPEEAERLLDEAGWTVGADGIREKDGQRLELVVGATSNSVAIKPGLEFVAQEWRRIGVALDNRAGDNTFAAKAFAEADVPLVGTRFFNWGSLGPRLDNDEQMVTKRAFPDLNEIFAAEERAPLGADKDALLEKEQRYIVADQTLVIVLWDEVQVHGVAQGVHIEFTSSTAPDFHGAWTARG